MEAFTLLLVMSISGFSYALHPRLILTQAAELKDDRAEWKSKQVKYISISGQNKTESIDAEAIEGRKAERVEGGEGVTPNPVGWSVEKEKAEEERKEEVRPTSQRDSKRQTTRKKTEREKRERKPVAGINRRERRRSAHKNRKREIVEGKKLRKAAKVKEIKMTKHEGLLVRQRKNHTVVNHTLPFSMTSAKVGQDSANPVIFQIITQPQDPPPPPPHIDPFAPSITPSQVPPNFSHLPTLHTQASFQLSPPSVNTLAPTSSVQSSGLTLKRGHPRRKGEKVKAESLLEEVENVSQSELRAEGTRTTNQGGNIAMPQVTTSRPEEDEFIIRNLITKELKPPLGLNKSKSTKLAKPAHKLNQTEPKLKNVQPTENDTKVMVKQSKTTPHRSSAEILHTTANTSLTRLTHSNRGSKNRTTKKSRENEGDPGNNNQTTAAVKKETKAPESVGFLDDYCPPVCICSGSVVQCSDKSVEKVPYGIPHNARSIFLINNYIKSIQPDLFAEYVSLEMLVLSNNWLTDGSIKGAFGGIPVLKHLHLNGNRLKSVPTDLPVSLEELRLDSNYLKAITETAWSRCPALLVLRLSNNNLGPESFPDAVLYSLRNLHTLSLDHNQLTSVPLGLPRLIKELYLKGNLIKKVDQEAFYGLSELEVLDLSANRLTNAGLKNSLNITGLESLNLEGNRLEHVPRHLPPSLTSLNLEGNLITSIKKVDFGRFIKLELLGLARNKLFEVAPGAFRELPNLHRLDLCHNALHQVPRQLPRGLHSVALTHNKIQSVPHDAFCWGNKSLSLRGFLQLHLEDNLIDVGKMDSRAFRCLKGFELVHSD